MINAKTIDDLASKLSDAVPPGAKAFQADMEKNFKQVLQTMIGKLDLVTREEFDVQSKVLMRTREKIDELEKTLKHLEEQLNLPQ